MNSKELTLGCTVVKLKMSGANSNLVGKSHYFESETWKCGQSTTGAHHWIITVNMMQCKYCHEERLQLSKPSRVQVSKSMWKEYGIAQERR